MAVNPPGGDVASKQAAVVPRVDPGYGVARFGLSAALVVMVAGILAVYWPIPSGRGNQVLFGADHLALHSRRIRYARDALLDPHPHVPGWYTRELMGTPFWSNLQNFPLIPTRLVPLLIGPYAGYAPAVMLAAVLAGLCTFLYARRIGLGPVAAAAAGWTFACAGFFASRVMAGHLPLLEAYPALPLLLWLAEICLHARGAEGGIAETQTARSTTEIVAGKTAGRPATDRFGLKLLVMGATCACVALAGHPQIPVYALTVAFLYVLWQGRRSPRRWYVAATMVLGVGAASFALWPMFRLITRSTRVLPLDPPDNDIAMPIGRLAALLFPWRDGWAGQVARSPGRPFAGYPNVAYFWDTVCYLGWLPVVATGYLGAVAIRRGRPPPSRGPWRFLIAAGGLALLLALPPARALVAHLPGTFLRSPARQMYVTGFVLALGLGAACDRVLTGARARRGAETPLSRRRRQRLAGRGRGRAEGGRASSRLPSAWPYALVAAALVAHALDLGAHDRAFIATVELPDGFSESASAGDDPVAQAEGGRAAFDAGLVVPLNRELDDVGFFDSIMLARPYRLILDLAGDPPARNIQAFDGSRLNAGALGSLGVKLVVTPAPRPDLNRVAELARGLPAYGLSNPAPRAAFFPGSAVGYATPDEVHAALRKTAAVPRSTLTLTRIGGPRGPAASVDSPLPASRPMTAPAAAAPVSYRRPDSDQIVIAAAAPVAGWVRVLESWDPGWRATVDGAPAEIGLAEDAFLAVQVPAGQHEVRLRYHTPGAMTGLTLSFIAMALLALLAAWAVGAVLLYGSDNSGCSG